MTDAPIIPAPEAPPAAPAAPQQADIQAMVNEATKGVAEQVANATRAAEQKIANAARALTGEPSPKPAQEKFLESFVTDPVKALHALKEVTKKEVRDEIQQVENWKRTQEKVFVPYLNEYPQLADQKKQTFIEAQTEKYERENNMTYTKALEQSCKDAVSEFGLKSVSEAQRAGSYSYGIPGGGGVSPGAPRFDEAKSSNDFLASLKARAASIRKRTS